MVASTPFAPEISTCVRCAGRSAAPFSVTSAGPARVLVRFRCRRCWAEWTEMRTMEALAIATHVSDAGREQADREQSHV